MGSRPSNASTGRQNDRVAAGAIAFVGRPAVRHVRTRTAGCFEECVGRLATYGDIAIGRENRPSGGHYCANYSQGGNCHWQPRMDSRLAGGVHLVSRLHDVAHDDRGDVLRLEPARSTVALTAAAPRSVAGTSLSAPPNVPILARTGLARTTAWDDLTALHISCSMAIGRSRTRLPVA